MNYRGPRLRQRLPIRCAIARKDTTSPVLLEPLTLGRVIGVPGLPCQHSVMLWVHENQGVSARACH